MEDEKLSDKMNRRLFKLRFKAEFSTAKVEGDDEEGKSPSSPAFDEDFFEPLLVQHIHYLDWPDDRAPHEEWLYRDVDTLIGIMDSDRKLYDRLETNDSDKG